MPVQGKKLRFALESIRFTHSCAAHQRISEHLIDEYSMVYNEAIVAMLSERKRELLSHLSPR